MRRAFLVVAAVALTACGGGGDDDIGAGATVPASSVATTEPTNADGGFIVGPPFTTVPTIDYGPAPVAPDGPNDEATAHFDDIVASLPHAFDVRDVQEFIDAGDVRHAWLLTDLLRFIQQGPDLDTIVAGFESLTGVTLDENELLERSPWNVTTNHLLAWDTPAPPDYQRLKGDFFKLVEEGWAPFFDDPDAEIDFRWLNWGGVFIDDRELGDPNLCDGRGCIPALDDPELVAAADGDWYPDDSIVFGVSEGDESVAFPRNIMQVHEMVNITIGERRFGIPYCTLCGSAQAFYTDGVPDGIETPVLRTSGLLSRSNKVMYDLITKSAFDTFTGAAVSGPLREAGVVLDQNSVTVSTWGEWKDEHPETRIVAEDGGIGRTYRDDPLSGRDDNGPIFPVGDVDARLGVHAAVLGVVLPDGTKVAFSTDALRAQLGSADDVTFQGITVTPDGGGFATEISGEEYASHEAFWFAWSQFHPDTLLWPNDA